MVSRVALVSLVGLVCLTFLTFHVTMANRAGNSSTKKPAMTSETFSAEESKRRQASLWPTIVATQESPQEVTSLLETVLATQLQRCQTIPLPTLQATRFLGILCLYAGCFVFWCSMLFPFILRGFCETSCFSCHANVLMFGLDKALLLLFFMPDVILSFPSSVQGLLFPNHWNLRAPITEIRVSRSKGETYGKTMQRFSFLSKIRPLGGSPKACC